MDEIRDDRGAAGPQRAQPRAGRFPRGGPPEVEGHVAGREVIGQVLLRVEIARQRHAIRDPA